MNKLRIRKLGILSVAKMYGVMGLIMGLIIGVFYGLVTIMFGAMMMGIGQREGLAAGGGSVVMGLVMMIMIPIFYGAFLFAAGAIGAVLYNIFAGFVGGIEIEVENVH